MQPLQTEFNPTIVSGGVKDIMKGIGASSSDLWKVRPQDLHVMPNLNARVRDERYAAKVRSIADSIKDEGFHLDQPLGVIVDNGKLFVTSGHRRHKASLLAISEGAELESVPVVVKPKSTSVSDLTAELVTTNNGDPLSAYELACVCKRLTNFQWDQKKIASRLNISVTYTDQLLTLMGSPTELLAMVHEGKMAAGTAYDLFKKHGADAVKVANGAVEKAAENGRTKATAKDLEGSKLKRALHKQAPAMYAALKALRDDPAALKIKKANWQAIQDVLDNLDGVE
jgi:ParB/RepB/Spo0J family partition protein